MSPLSPQPLLTPIVSKKIRRDALEEVHMPRAKLFLIPGYIWHLTHRCHNRQFLLRFDRDRRVWMDWMYRGKTRYGLHVLNYSVTSNHIHLLVYADGKRHVIPRSILLAASRTALEYNRRKSRSGAFWEGNYHATAIETGSHFRNCLMYIDLNMVRAGVVKHPRDWPFCGYQEIFEQRIRNCLIDKKLLMNLIGVAGPDELVAVYQDWIMEVLKSKDLSRKPKWTESVAVGREAFIDKIKADLGLKTLHREIIPDPIDSTGYVLKDPRWTYMKHKLWP
jgi:putative transposase